MMNFRHLVLIPGLLCTIDLYRAQIEHLADTEITVADTLQDDTIDGMARRLLSSAPNLFDLCGLSMGGYVALEVIRIAPERVRSLVLMATSAKADTDEQITLRNRLIAVGRERGIGAVADALLPRMLGEQSLDKPALKTRIRNMAIAVGQDAFERQQHAVMTRRDQSATLGTIAVRTTIASGTDDKIIDPQRSHEMANAIPRARHEIAPCFGHMLTMEAPAWSTAILQRHIGETT